MLKAQKPIKCSKCNDFYIGFSDKEHLCDTCKNEKELKKQYDEWAQVTQQHLDKEGKDRL